jgi:hypothetical protein
LAPEPNAKPYAQVNAPGEQEAAGAFPPPREPVRTFTDVNVRSTFVPPHDGHGGAAPSEYALMDIRTPKGWLQSRQTKSYAGTV